MLPSGQGRPDFVSDCEIHDHNGAAENKMKMRGYPRGIVDHRVHSISIVHDPAEPTETQHHKSKSGGEDHGAIPWQGRNPPEHASPPAKSASDFKRRGDGENREQRRDGNEHCQEHLDKLGPVTVLGVHHQVMHPNRQAVDEKQNKG